MDELAMHHDNFLEQIKIHSLLTSKSKQLLEDFVFKIFESILEFCYLFEEFHDRILNIEGEKEAGDTNIE